MKQKALLQVSAYYPPHLGGQENVVQDLSAQLAAAGHEVKVLTSAVGGGRPGLSHEARVPVRRLRALEFGHTAIMPGFALELLRAATKHTVVHLHIGQAFTPEIVWLISKIRRFPYIAELHIDFEPSGPAGVLLPLYKRFIMGPVLRGAAAVIVLNEKTLRLVHETYGYRGKAVIVSNGIDEDFFAVKRAALALSPPKTLRLLFVGRLSKQKNVPILLEAMKLTKRSVSLDIAGEGCEYKTIRAKIKELGLTNVKLHGRLQRKAVLQLYKTCDVLVMPSLYEAQPLVLLEAMAARIPIIGTNVIGVSEHIQDCGIVVEPTPEGIAEGFERTFARYHTLPGLVERAYNKASKLRWSNLLKEYEALYATVRS